MKITTLCENALSRKLRWVGGIAEWGFSILVEADDHKILLDAGASASTVRNAELMGIDLSEVDKIVLSHGHHGHTGGLQSVLSRMGKKVEVIAHPDIWAAKYVRIDGNRYIYEGIPFQREQLESLGASFTLTKEPVWINDNIVTSGEIPLDKNHEEIDPTVFVKEDGRFHHDPLLDYQALIIKDRKGLVIIMGCTHRGILRLLSHTKRLTGMEKIHTLMGGIDLLRINEECLELSIAELKASDIHILRASGCMEMPIVVKLALEFGDKFSFNTVGRTIEI